MPLADAVGETLVLQLMLSRWSQPAAVAQRGAVRRARRPANRRRTEVAVARRCQAKAEVELVGSTPFPPGTIRLRAATHALAAARTTQRQVGCDEVQQLVHQRAVASQRCPILTGGSPDLSVDRCRPFQGASYPSAPATGRSRSSRTAPGGTTGPAARTPPRRRRPWPLPGRSCACRQLRLRAPESGRERHARARASRWPRIVKRTQLIGTKSTPNTSPRRIGP